MLLTRQHGQVRAVAKGVARTNSRFGGRLQPFNLVDLQLHKGRNLDTVTQVQTLEAYAGPIMGNYSAYTCAATMAETTQRLTEEVNAYEGANSQYLLLVGALNALARARHPSGLVLDSYLLRSLSLAGWAPSCFDCALCGAKGPHEYFSVQNGGALCESCRQPGSIHVDNEAMVLLGALLSGDWPTVYACPAVVRGQVSAIVSAYVTWHLERRLASLSLVERA